MSGAGGENACTTMTPGHGITPSSATGPYVVLVSKNTYLPGDKITGKQNYFIYIHAF
jgi:hypothetical protein